MQAQVTASIRRATAADAPALAQLSAESFAAKFGHLYPPDTLASFLAETYAVPVTVALLSDPANTVWVADDGHTDEMRLLAYAIVGPCKLPHPDVTRHCIELKRLYTAPDVTGGGLGARFMRNVVLPACDQAAAAGGDAWLGVYSDNPGAQRFYARYGFSKAGEYWFPVGPVRDLEFILRRKRP